MLNWTIAPVQGPLRLTARADAGTGHISVIEDAPDAGPAQVRAHVAQPGGAAQELDLSPTGPGEYGASFLLNGPATYIVRVDEERDGMPIGAAEAGLPVSYPAEFRQVSADPGRMLQIANAGGGHVLASPAAAFATDLAPVTTPLPLQRVLVLIAAILLPIEIGLRRLRLSFADLVDWLRHPRRMSMDFPRWSPDLPVQYPTWMPGAWKPRPVPPPISWARRTAETALGAHVTPGLARDTDLEGSSNEEDDALGATLRWLAARRGTSGDRG
jgi:hypothetical protein